MNTKPIIRLMSIVAAVASAALTGPLAAEESYQVALSSSEHNRVVNLTFRELVFATLTVSRDLKDYGKYHCPYYPELGHADCDHMNTTSGQYADFYHATMSSCEKSEFCSEARLGIPIWDYMLSDSRICKHLTTGSCAKEVLTKQDVRQELLDLLSLKSELLAPISRRGLVADRTTP